MAKQKIMFLGLLTLCFVFRCRATTYIVGDNSGWDISTDVDSWAQDKHFVVGDVLVFQYDSSHSVAEVNQHSYQRCNTTNVLQPGSTGNTTFALTKPGDRYFVCGNKLHCYAGMKLHVVVDGKLVEGPAHAPTLAPVPAPEAPKPETGGDSTTATTTATTNPSSKNNNPSSLVPNSAMFMPVGFKIRILMVFTCLVSWIV
ncbi:hypothetical protein OSB04_026282 [Centaurea solstitialis]|uniref:Phytocyanin domain-containing protein n=1 Tax=Centaurea solstitialis TaxID=347529 RepID=A0AA38SPU0_9ASTR|nr:hypothetical protein OSB04_026282 [Centaurea solstitialis]